MEQRGRELNRWDELVEKAIDVEAKAVFQSLFMLCEMDQDCWRGNRPIYTKSPRSGLINTSSKRQAVQDRFSAEKIKIRMVAIGMIKVKMIAIGIIKIGMMEIGMIAIGMIKIRIIQKAQIE